VLVQPSPGPSLVQLPAAPQPVPWPLVLAPSWPERQCSRESPLQVFLVSVLLEAAAESSPRPA
jgi:hypothetical protein